MCPISLWLYYHKNKTASTAVFVDYWALDKTCFFYFVAYILVEALFQKLLGTLSQHFGPAYLMECCEVGNLQKFIMILLLVLVLIRELFFLHLFCSS